MARTTDRQHISEAVRLATGRGDTWGTYHYLDGKVVHVDLFNDTGHELNITYSPAGRITKLVHWQPHGDGPEDQASRQPIHTNKRQHVLDVIKGEG